MGTIQFWLGHDDFGALLVQSILITPIIQQDITQADFFFIIHANYEKIDFA